LRTFSQAPSPKAATNEAEQPTHKEQQPQLVRIGERASSEPINGSIKPEQTNVSTMQQWLTPSLSLFSIVVDIIANYMPRKASKSIKAAKPRVKRNPSKPTKKAIPPEPVIAIKESAPVGWDDADTIPHIVGEVITIIEAKSQVKGSQTEEERFWPESESDSSSDHMDVDQEETSDQYKSRIAREDVGLHSIIYPGD
jgi:hypothetical protein